MWEIGKIYQQNDTIMIDGLSGFAPEVIDKLLIARDDVLLTLKNVERLKNWNIAYKFYKTNITTLLKNDPSTQMDFICYQMKIIMNSGYEFVETSKRHLSNLFPQKVRKFDGQEMKSLSEGEWVYKDLTGQIYDNNFAYRLCYNLRNCLQHVGAEGLVLKVDSERDTIGLDLIQYIAGHVGIQPKFKSELLLRTQTEDTLDLLPVIDQYNTSIQELYKMIIKECSCKEIEKELHASLIIKKYLGEQFVIEPTAKYVLLNSEIHEDVLKSKIPSINVKKALDYADYMCQIFVMKGSAYETETDTTNQFPYQVNESEYKIGDTKVKNTKSYIKLIDRYNEFGYTAIYVLECLFDKERQAVMNGIQKYLEDR